MPCDNNNQVCPGDAVLFPQDGANRNGAISRVSDGEFNLSQRGTYQVMFQVSVQQAGQLVIALNGEELDFTVVGRNADDSQIVGMALVTVTERNSLLSIRNPNSECQECCLDITRNAGGENPVSAHLVITRLR